jgi:hypothetical protein
MAAAPQGESKPQGDEATPRMKSEDQPGCRDLMQIDNTAVA